MIARGLLTIGFLLITAPLLATSFRVWGDLGSVVLPSGTIALIIGMGCLLCGGLFQPKLGVKCLREWYPSVFVAALALVALMFSDWQTLPFNLFGSYFVRGEILVLGVLTYILYQRLPKILSIGAIFSPIALLALFLILSQGRQYIRDDGATFFYRLSMLREHFPGIPFYNPLWNAGTDERAFFATGSLNVFFIFSPLIYFCSLEAVYNLIVGALAVILLPMALWWVGFRVSRCWQTASIAALLAILPSSLWYKWIFTFGTLGFTTSCTLLVPVLWAILLHLRGEVRSLKFTGFTAIVTSLMLCWSPSGIVFLPLVLVAFWQIVRGQFIRRLWLLALLLVVVNGSWMFAFWKVSNVSSFLVSKPTAQVLESELVNGKDFNVTTPQEDKPVSKHKKRPLEVRAVLKGIRSALLSCNPMVFVLGMVGLFFLPVGVRVLYGSVWLWSFILGSVGSFIMPQLELDRMHLVAQILLVVPAALSINRILSSIRVELQENWLSRVVKQLSQLWVFGMLGCGALIAASIIQNKTSEKLAFKTKEVDELVEFIRSQPMDGRLLFSGSSAHDLNGGHLAPLTVYTQHPLVASSQFGDIWTYTDVVPLEFRQKGVEGIEAYLSLLNVQGVFAQEPKQLKFFREHRKIYQQIWTNGQYSYFKRTDYSPSYFAAGSGSVVTQAHNKVVLNLSSESAVLKFRYFPFLRASHCNISASVLEDGQNYIKLDACPIGELVTIDSVNLLERVLM